MAGEVSAPLQRSQDSLDLEAHWRAIRGDALVPHRDAFDPLDVPKLLPRLFLFQIEPDEPVRVLVRVFGTDLVERVGADVTGRNFLDFVDEGERDEAADAMVRCATMPCGRRRTHRTSYERGYAALSEVTYFPMLSSDLDRPYLLGVSVLIATENAERGVQHLMRVSRRSRAKPYLDEYIDIGAGVPPG